MRSTILPVPESTTRRGRPDDRRRYVVDGPLMPPDIAPPEGRPENSSGQRRPPLSLHVGNSRKLADCGRNIFWQGQVDDKQGHSSSIARSSEKYLKGHPDSIARSLSLLPYVMASAVVVTSSEVVRNCNAARGPRGGRHFRFALISGQTRTSYEMLAGTPPDRAH
jgi:hypothetical protein